MTQKGSNLAVRIDEDKKLLIFNIKGEINSRALAGDIIKAYQAIPKPWSYSRIYDYRRSRGLFDYDQIARVMDWWHDTYKDVPDFGKIAVITFDVLFEIRAKDFGSQSQKEEIRTFENMRTALEWLGISDLDMQTG